MKEDHRSGFTLIELLVSMTLLSLLLAAAFSGLRFVNRAGDKLEARIEDADTLDLVRSLLIRQLANAFPIAAATNPPNALFTGREDRLAFPILRVPGQGPAGLVLAVFDVVKGDGVFRLIYREYPFLPGPNISVAEQPTRSTLLVESHHPIRFRYQDGFGNWLDRWSAAGGLPKLVAIKTPDWPEIAGSLKTQAISR